MADYIERETAMRAACKALCISGPLCPDACCSDVRDVFETLPAADVRPVVHGRWIKPEPGDGTPYCSHCKRQAPAAGAIYWYPAFCPSCGADMRADKIQKKAP